MKNTIKMNRTNEINAKKAAEAAAAHEAALKDIKPLNIVETLKQLEEEKTDARVVCDKDGNPIAVCGGKYLCESYKGEIIGAATQEKLDAIKARIDKGIHGDGLLHKMVTINGKSIPCVGASEKEIDADIKSIEVYSKEHPTEPRRDLTVATMLKEAGYKSANLEQIAVEGKDYLLVYEGLEGEKNLVMDLEGNSIVSLQDIPDELRRETVKKLLLERLNTKIKQEKPRPAPTPKAEPKPAPKRTRKTKTVVVTATQTVVIRPCSIVISRVLGQTTLENVIKGALRGQDWTSRPYGNNPECPWLDKVIYHGWRDAARTAKVERGVIIPTTTFIMDRIVSESPIEANSLEELVKKVEAIVYNALKDEPYFGMVPEIGRQLAETIAYYIVSSATVIYR